MEQDHQTMRAKIKLAYKKKTSDMRMWRDAYQNLERRQRIEPIRRFEPPVLLWPLRQSAPHF